MYITNRLKLAQIVHNLNLEILHGHVLFKCFFLFQFSPGEADGVIHTKYPHLHVYDVFVREFSRQADSVSS